MTLRITVLGCGYLGTTHAAGMAELGFEVMGMDVDEDRVATLAAGRAPMYEPHLEPMLRTHVDSGRLRFTTSYEEVAQFGDVHFLCIGTPQKKGEYATDLRYQHGVVDGLSPHLDRPALVVGKSTVPTGSRQLRRPPATSTWCGTRSSCVKGSPCTTPCTPTGSCWGPTPSRPSRRCVRSTPRRSPTAPR
jgi:UDPglucose 6-dehydrogenase